jgi:DNA replication protein DnaC
MGNFGYIFADATGCMYFCGTDACLKDDSDASKAMKSNISYHAEPTDAAIKFGIGKDYVNASLSKWKANPRQCEIVNNWSKELEGFLTVVGKPGTGKTYFCAAIANHLLNKKKQVKYLQCRRFYETIQNVIANDKSQYECIRQIAQNEILILDDIAASTNSEWQKEVLLDLIDQRYANRMPTIIITNLTRSDSIIALGERTAHRVFSNIVLEVVPHV